MEFKVEESVFNEIITAIEQYEEKIEGEWGVGKSLKSLIACNEMPELYYTLIKIRDGRMGDTSNI